MDTMRDGAIAKSPGPDWADLVRAISNEDQVALEALYLLCRKGVFSIAYSVLRDRDLAEDVLQETLIYVWDHAQFFRYESHPRLWIARIARHLAIDLQRSNRSWLSLDEMDVEDFDENPALPGALDEELTLWEGIERLEPLEAQVFVLKAVVGLRHDETAAVLDIPRRRVHYQYRKALGKLRKFLSCVQ